ncbi:MAG: hypothetical protein ACHQIK_01220 [Candidatus Acidiferrales bacterium]
MKTFARASCRTPYQLSPPASISPVPPQVGQSPLPPQAEQADSCPNTMTSSEILSRNAFPFPWQTEQFPSPGKSQLGQVWVAILHLPTLSAILVWFHVTVKTRHAWKEQWGRGRWREQRTWNRMGWRDFFENQRQGLRIQVYVEMHPDFELSEGRPIDRPWLRLQALPPDNDHIGLGTMKCRAICEVEEDLKHWLGRQGIPDSSG